MLSDERLTELSYIISARFEAVNSHYLKLMGEHIRKIGKLSPSDLHRLEQMQKMSMNIDVINKELAQATNMSLDDLKKIYDISGMSVYGDSAKYYMAKGIKQIPFEENKWIQNYIESIKTQTNGTFLNISNTTSIQSDYRDLVDTAITSVSSGMVDYKTAIRQQMSDAALQGIRVQYASGMTRRLDSAIRMNVLEGVRQINNGIMERVGEEFGADGVEISVHGLCAKDHIDIQGRIFAKGDVNKIIDGVEYQSFNKINENLKRRISTCNCKHKIYQIVLGVSEPTYSEQQLQEYKQNSEQPVTLTTGYKNIGTDESGNTIYEPKTKTVTKYEATQYQRNIETEIRKSKDLYIIAESSGDEVLKKQARLRINELRAKYKRISQEAGLTPKWDRCYVPGYNGKQVTPKSIKININQNLDTIKNSALQEQIRLLSKYKNTQNLMFTGTSQDLADWSKYQKITNKGEKEIIKELYNNPENWELALQLQNEKMLEPFLNQLLDTATDAELSALNMWTGETYALINRYARYGIDVDDISKNASINIESILNKLKTPQDLIVHRGTGINHILSGANSNWKNDIESLIGHEFTDKGFTATSPLSSGAFGGAGETKAELFIKVPKGTHGAYIATESHLELEKEFLLQKGYTYKIVKAEYRPNPIFPDEKDLKIWCEIIKK